MLAAVEFHCRFWAGGAQLDLESASRLETTFRLKVVIKFPQSQPALPWDCPSTMEPLGCGVLIRQSTPISSSH